MDWLNENWESVVAAVGGIIITARVIVKLTPTPADDRWLAKVLAFLKHVGLYIPVILLLAILPLMISCVPRLPEGYSARVFVADPEVGAKGGLMLRPDGSVAGFGRFLGEDGEVLEIEAPVSVPVRVRAAK